MNLNKKREIEAKLKQMLRNDNNNNNENKNIKQTRIKEKKSTVVTVIRRRKGMPDKSILYQF